LKGVYVLSRAASSLDLPLKVLVFALVQVLSGVSLGALSTALVVVAVDLSGLFFAASVLSFQMFTSALLGFSVGRLFTVSDTKL